MLLKITLPPFADDDGWIEIGTHFVAPVYARDGPPREIRGAGIEDLLIAVEKACAVIWGGRDWKACIEQVCDLRPGTARRWIRRGEIPPPQILGWIAYLRSWDDARAQGRALMAVTTPGYMATPQRLARALRGLRGD